MAERVRLHVAARAGNPQHCTQEDRWKKEDVFAVKREGQKNAVALFGRETKKGGGEAEALALIDEKKEAGNGLSLELREGDEYVRCRWWCDVKKFCPLLKERGVEL